ncbi:MAG: hypothetical protein AAB347_13470 [Bacteroidota bacterium]
MRPQLVPMVIRKERAGSNLSPSTPHDAATTVIVIRRLAEKQPAVPGRIL